MEEHIGSRTDLKHILLVEDDRNDVELTLYAFDEMRLANTVDVVCDGEEALDYLLRRGAFGARVTGAPAVVLLDIKLPKVDGIEVLRRLRASSPEGKVIPVVMFTSSRDDGDLLRSYSLGINAFVVKPVEFIEFAQAIRTVGLFWAVLNEPPPMVATGLS